MSISTTLYIVFSVIVFRGDLCMVAVADVDWYGCCLWSVGVGSILWGGGVWCGV